MTVAVLLDSCVLPEKGAVDFNISCSFALNISAEEACREVNHWLFTQVSCMLGAGTPTLVIGERVVWRVPVILTASHIGHVGAVGAVDVDVQTAEMNNTPARQEEILKSAQALATKMTPYQPRKTTPPEYIARDIQPTNTRPQGNPLDIINATRNSIAS